MSQLINTIRLIRVACELDYIKLRAAREDNALETCVVYLLCSLLSLNSDFSLLNRNYEIKL